MVTCQARTSRLGGTELVACREPLEAGPIGCRAAYNRRHVSDCLFDAIPNALLHLQTPGGIHSPKSLVHGFGICYLCLKWLEGEGGSVEEVALGGCLRKLRCLLADSP